MNVVLEENVTQKTIEPFGAEQGILLRERLDVGRGKKVYLEVEYCEPVEQYSWKVSSSAMNWVGFENSFESAVDVACQVYRDYMEVDDD